MPNIVEYDSKSGITPSDKGINAAVDAARHFARVGDSIGRDVSRGLNKIGDAVENHMAVMEGSELYKTGTEFELNAEKRWLEYSAENRGNPHAGDQFMAEIAPQLDQWGSGVNTDRGKQLAATLKANIRNKLFNRIAADQAEMDYAHVDDNHTQTKNTLSAQLVIDPSEANFRRTLGTMRAANESMTGTIPDVSMREQAFTHYNKQDYSDLAVARYVGVAQNIKNQIADTGADTSPALEQLNKDIKDQLGFEYLSPEQQTQVSALGERAVAQGQELYNSKNATAKAKVIEEGKAAYAELHNTITNRALAGQGPTPEDVTAIQQFSRHYGGVLPSETAALDDFALRGQSRAQSNEVQPYNQTTRDNIQAGFSRPVGDPQRPTLASLTQAYSHGKITKEDFSSYSDIISRLDSPEKDPSFKPAWDAFQRWQKFQITNIGRDNNIGATRARAAFEHDVTATYMARGRAHGWDDALKWITDANHPGSFGGAEIKGVYQKAAEKGPDWLRDNAWQVNENGSITRPWKSGTGGARPPVAAPAPAQSRVPAAADIDKADEMLWGKK